jgi:hypothetical protein
LFGSSIDRPQRLDCRYVKNNLIWTSSSLFPCDFLLICERT